MQNHLATDPIVLDDRVTIDVEKLLHLRDRARNLVTERQAGIAREAVVGNAMPVREERVIRPYASSANGPGNSRAPAKASAKSSPSFPRSPGART